MFDVRLYTWIRPLITALIGHELTSDYQVCVNVMAVLSERMKMSGNKAKEDRCAELHKATPK